MAETFYYQVIKIVSSSTLLESKKYMEIVIPILLTITKLINRRIFSMNNFFFGKNQTYFYFYNKNFKLNNKSINNFTKGGPLVSLLKIVDVEKVTLNPHQKPNQFTL